MIMALSKVRWGFTIGAAGVVALVTASVVGVSPAEAAPLAQQSQTFAYTGASQTFTVPAGVDWLTVTAAGAGGLAGYDSGPGGFGALVIGTMPVTPGDVWTIDVGGRGSGRSGGWGGYKGGDGGASNGGGGGGATTMNDGQEQPPIVLGGGGGSGSGSSSSCSGGGGGVGGDITNAGSMATNGGNGHCIGNNGGGAANVEFTTAPSGERAGSKGGDGGSSDGGGGGGGGGGYGGGKGGSGGDWSGGGGGGGGSIAGQIQNTGIGQAGTVTDGSVLLQWTPGGSDVAAKAVASKPVSAAGGPPSGRSGQTGLSMAVGSTSSGAGNGSGTINVVLGGAAVLGAGLVVLLLVRRRRRTAGE